MPNPSSVIHVFHAYAVASLLLWNEGHRVDRLAYEQLKALLLKCLELSHALPRSAARIKTSHLLYVDDALFAASDLKLISTFLHKYLQFRGIPDLCSELYG